MGYIFGMKPSEHTRPAETPLQRRGMAFVRHLRGEAPPPQPERSRSEPRIGVALGGGAARGLTHIPYIEAMDELGLTPSVISGTSIGALIGAGWAAGMSGRELREHSVAVLGTLRIIAGRLWGARVKRLSNFFAGALDMQLDARQVVDAFLPAPFPEDFGALRVPFYVVATDYQSWHQAVFSSGPLRDAIAGSIAIPSVFKPVRFADHLLVDGCVVNPLPLDQAADSDILVGIDVNGDPSEPMRRSNTGMVDLWFGSAQIMMHSLSAHMMAAYPPDVYVRPHVMSFGAHEFWRVREIFAHVEKDKDNFKRALERRIEAFHQGTPESHRAEDR
jgi:NTE family protein